VRTCDRSAKARGAIEEARCAATGRGKSSAIRIDCDGSLRLGSGALAAVSRAPRLCCRGGAHEPLCQSRSHSGCIASWIRPTPNSTQCPDSAGYGQRRGGHLPRYYRHMGARETRAVVAPWILVTTGTRGSMAVAAVRLRGDFSCHAAPGRLTDTPAATLRTADWDKWPAGRTPVGQAVCRTEPRRRRRFIRAECPRGVSLSAVLRVVLGNKSR
jgi:hypothetical protein